MLVQILMGLVDFMFMIISKVATFVLSPIFKYLFEKNIISIDYFNMLSNWINNTFFGYLKFARDVFINVTGIPVPVMSIISMVLIIYFELFVACFVIKFLLNGYSLFKTGNNVYRTFGGK